MDNKVTNFRVILALTTTPQEINLTGVTLKVTLSHITKTLPFNSKEATPLDFPEVLPGAKVEFGLEDDEGFMFGYSELKVPSIAFEKNETELTDQIRFYLINREKDSFVANVFAIFLNKGLFKEKAKERGVLNSSRASPIKQVSFERQTSRSPGGSPAKRSPSKGKSGEVKNFQCYLNRLVDTHSVQIKSLVEEHNAINEYIHLNKLQNNLPKNYGDDNLETYSPLKLKSTGNLSRTFDNNEVNESPMASFYKSASLPNEETYPEERSVSKELTSLREKEKETTAYFPANGETTIRQQETSERASATIERATDRSPSRLSAAIAERITERSPARASSIAERAATERSPSRTSARSPLRNKASLERKLSESGFSSPVKRRQVDEATTPSRREAPDTTFYDAQINTLNNVIINQTSKLADLELYQKENEELRAEIQKSENARKTLQESVLETVNELKQENKELEKQVGTVVAEKEGLLMKIGELQNSVQALSNILAITKAALQEKEDANTQNAVKLAELNDLREEFSKIQEALITSENQKIKDQENYKASLARFELSLQDTTKAINTLNQEKKKLTEDLHQVQHELGRERANHQATQNELLLTKKNLENAENYKNVIVSLEAQRDQLNKQLAESRTNHTQTKQVLQDSVEKLAARQREFEENEKIFTQDVNVLSEKLAVSESKNERVTKDLNEQKLKVTQLNTAVSSLEQLVCVKEDVGKQLEATTKQLIHVTEDRKALRTQLDAVVVSQDQTNAKLFEVEKAANQLRQTIEDQDDHIEHLTQTVVQLRENQDMYVPIKGDTIDNAMADYINTAYDANRLKLLFLREAEGVYQFGSKRVYVKLEGGKIILRVGGGFLVIDEFLEQYGPLECEKLERTDPIKKLSMNIAVNKTLIGKCVNQMERAKTLPYEYRTDSSNMRILNSSPSLKRFNSKGEY